MVGCQSNGSKNDVTSNVQTEASSEKVTLKIGQTNYAAHGTKAFAVASALTDKDKVVLSHVDELQFMSAGSATGVAISTDGLAENLVEGKVLASKHQNSETYSATADTAGYINAVIQAAKSAQ